MISFSKKYFKYLNNELAGLNLTAIKDEHEFYQKQILDSILPLQLSTIFSHAVNEAGYVVDVGFGGGFPLLPLAFQNPLVRFLGLEARGKKVMAVEKLINYFQLSNVSTHHARLENIFFDMDCVVLFKAVGTVDDLLSKINTDLPIKVFFYKGPQFMEKEADAISKIQNQWKMIMNESIPVPGTLGRQLVGFQKIIVPRRTNIRNNRKRLVNISQFL